MFGKYVLDITSQEQLLKEKYKIVINLNNSSQIFKLKIATLLLQRLNINIQIKG